MLEIGTTPSVTRPFSEASRSSFLEAFCTLFTRTFTVTQTVQEYWLQCLVKTLRVSGVVTYFLFV